MAAAGQIFPSDPETFKGVEGDLYLFFNGEVNGERLNSIVNWNEDEAALKAEAEAAWQTLK